MPGANYFLSKLATQTPGPLVGSTVVKSAPSSCLELVPVAATKPEDDFLHVSSYNICHDIGSVYPKDPRVYRNVSHRNTGRPLTHTGPYYSPLPISVNGLEENPVGELQELCTKMRWVFPSYTVCCENGQPHERTFVIAVRLYNVKEKGEAKSKKAAKREAAKNLLYQLLERSAEPRFSTVTQSAALEYRPLPEPSKTCGSQQVQFHHFSPPNSKCVDMLQELAVRRNLRVIYIRLDSRTSTGLIKVMLQISTCPIIVVNGQGRTVMEAKAEAALNALECIRITAKKMPFQSVNLPH